jgi:hypothetical protein
MNTYSQKAPATFTRLNFTKKTTEGRDEVRGSEGTEEDEVRQGDQVNEGRWAEVY